MTYESGSLGRRLTAFLAMVAVAWVLGAGAAQSWHRHVLGELQLFHLHSHLGGHHHGEFHERAAARYADHESQNSEQEESHSDLDCTLVGSTIASLGAKAAFATPELAARRRSVSRGRVGRPQGPVLRSRARAPPA